MSLTGKTLFITGASRGIGLAIALRAARDGANIVVAAKTTEAHKHLPGTIYSAAEDIEKAGGQALPIVVDVRHEDSVQAAIDAAVARFGGIDILVNNASAISKTGVEDSEMKRWDLMNQVNTRGTFLASKAAIPHLKKAANPHVLTLSPPLNLDPKWFAGHVAYTITKYSMSMAMLGMAEEYREAGIAFNCLWPRVGIATSAIEFAVGNSDEMRKCRKPEIMSDAAYRIFTKPARECTGNFFIDDTFLYDEGVRDFAAYKNDPTSKEWRVGMFLPDGDVAPEGSL
ncbi:SDR family oxidoreductase [Sphingomonas crocodyli]|uniref:NAD(P)-dependent oxidoreductase n=1 Tax=Sphingomonas crocodyli TaxID=1979270 RepID=A0A437MA89_9SPHN|nr:NAD(P)-dependent oxidoreductase [Sphingomonas crocodyli]RVT94483.1 NAD(P)-dependent oxidoreductase [Sphingomonas crocodyli]